MLDNAVASKRIKEITGIGTEPVAVLLLGADKMDKAASFQKVEGHRYCQLIMRARHGESVVLMPDELTCPAASAAFGFHPLTESLATGKALAGFGIVREPSTGRTMFEEMPHFEPHRITAIAATPLEVADFAPDVVVIEGQPESLMWLLLADLNVAGGKRRHSDTAVLQATCVDALVIPSIEKRLNFSMGCYGCREATDLGTDETVLGFPGSLLEQMVGALEHLAQKAVDRSRSKSAFQALQKNISI